MFSKALHITPYVARDDARLNASRRHHIRADAAARSVWRLIIRDSAMTDDRVASSVKNSAATPRRRVAGNSRIENCRTKPDRNPTTISGCIGSFGAVTADRTASDGQAARAGDAAAGEADGVIRDGAALDRQRAIIRNAAAVGHGGVVANRTRRDRGRAAGVDPAASLDSAVTRNGAAGDRKHAAVLRNAAAVDTCAIATDGAVGNGQCGIIAIDTTTTWGARVAADRAATDRERIVLVENPAAAGIARSRGVYQIVADRGVGNGNASDFAVNAATRTIGLVSSDSDDGVRQFAIVSICFAFYSWIVV